MKKIKFISLFYFLLAANVYAENSFKETLLDQAPFLKGFLDSKHEDNFKPDPYAHYISVSYAPLSVLMTGAVSSKLDNMHFFHFSYGQYNRLLRLPGRFMLDFGAATGMVNVMHQPAMQDLTFFFMGAMQDFILELKYFYISGGLGVYIRQDRDNRVGSNFVFGQKVAIGKVFDEKYDVQLFFRHMSNGYLATPNNGFNYFGIQLGLMLK
jgi:hypothetical protein